MSRLRRLARVALNIRCAVRAAGGWTGLCRQLLGARPQGWRDVYGTLIGLLAMGGRRRDRWYRLWLDRNEVRGADTESRLAVISSPDDTRNLDDACVGAVFVRPRYRLHNAALPAMANALAEGAELVYGDADEIDSKGRRCRPSFKPDFSLDLFLYQDYLSDCIAVSREVLHRLPPWDFDDPHGTLLRWLPRVSRIVHLPQVLSHALEPPVGAQEPPPALAEYLRTCYGDHAAVETVATPGASPVHWRCRFGTSLEPRVTVVIPTRDRLDLLQPCVDSLFATDTASHVEVLIIDNGSSEPATHCWLREVQRQHLSLRVLGDDGHFNWSRLNNLGIAAGTGDVFLFLNNDTLAIEDGWLDRLAEYALREDVGAVGPLLLFADGAVQHAGLVVGHGDQADPIYRGTAPDFEDHAFVSPRLPRNVAAVTGACLATSRKTLDAIGTFDEDLPLAGDVEFCLRAYAAGRVNVYAGDVAVRHHESATIGRRSHGTDAVRLGRLVQATLPRDPFYNPNLTGIAGVGRGAPAFALLHEDTSDAHLEAKTSKPRPPPVNA
ncbi:MAG: glycosyltransferase [Gammaproteobacteria bacterium]|nr:glycosyltransferase [Gammaproteobacteria bacterium]